MIYDSAVGVLTANTSCARICALIVKTCLLQGAVAIMHAIKLTKRRWTNVAFLATAYGLIGFGISFTISMLSARFGDTRIKYFRIVWRRWKRNWRALYSKMPFSFFSKTYYHQFSCKSWMDFHCRILDKCRLQNGWLLSIWHWLHKYLRKDLGIVCQDKLHFLHILNWGCIRVYTPFGDRLGIRSCIYN